MSLTRSRAAALGALHGPAELLPISSSAHLTLVPWLLGWRLEELSPEVRKSFEVALHVGTLAGLLAVRRDGLRLGFAVVSSLPAAAAGYTLEGPVQRRLGTPATIAAGLVAGSVAMTLADRAPQRRGADDARARDALLIGISQATALMPGVSRHGASLAAARALGFTRAGAEALAGQAALPVLAGAGLLKAARIARHGLPAPVRAPFAVGATASLASTVACARWLGKRRGGAVTPWVLYRTGLAAVVAARCKTIRGR